MAAKHAPRSVRYIAVNPSRPMTAPTVVRMVGAVRGREARAAQCQVHRSEPFAANPSRPMTAPTVVRMVGAVIGREGSAP